MNAAWLAEMAWNCEKEQAQLTLSKTNLAGRISIGFVEARKLSSEHQS
jgi:hypothetical protein